jgi:hypothetical protein
VVTHEPHRPAEPLWPHVVVAFGALAVLGALWTMDWATRVDDLGRETFTDGPTRLLVPAALTSLLLSLVTVFTRWRAPRWLLLASTLATVVTAVVVALSRIAAANHTMFREAGTTTTSYGLGAVVGVGAALVSAVFALLGLLQPGDRTEPAPLGGQPSPDGSPPLRSHP